MKKILAITTFLMITVLNFSCEKAILKNQTSSFDDMNQFSCGQLAVDNVSINVFNQLIDIKIFGERHNHFMNLSYQELRKNYTPGQIIQSNDFPNVNEQFVNDNSFEYHNEFKFEKKNYYTQNELFSDGILALMSDYDPSFDYRLRDLFAQPLLAAQDMNALTPSHYKLIVKMISKLEQGHNFDFNVAVQTMLSDQSNELSLLNTAMMISIAEYSQCYWQNQFGSQNSGYERAPLNAVGVIVVVDVMGGLVGGLLDIAALGFEYGTFINFPGYGATPVDCVTGEPLLGEDSLVDFAQDIATAWSANVQEWYDDLSDYLYGVHEDMTEDEQAQLLEETVLSSGGYIDEDGNFYNASGDLMFGPSAVEGIDYCLEFGPNNTEYDGTVLEGYIGDYLEDFVDDAVDASIPGVIIQYEEDYEDNWDGGGIWRPETPEPNQSWY